MGAENLCHQVIFMDYATGAFAPPDAETIQVGDVCWQRAQWRGLVEGAVQAVGVAEVLTLSANCPDLCF